LGSTIREADCGCWSASLTPRVTACCYVAPVPDLHHLSLSFSSYYSAAHAELLLVPFPPHRPVTDYTFDLATPPHGTWPWPEGGRRRPSRLAPWLAEWLMLQSEYQWSSLSPSDGSLSPQSLSSEGHVFAHDQFDVADLARAVDPLGYLTPPPTLPLASGLGSEQEILPQGDAEPDPFDRFSHFAGIALPAAPAAQQLLGGSNATTPMPDFSTANSFNANVPAFAFNSPSPEFYGNAHSFHLSNSGIPAYAGSIPTSHRARLTRDAQYMYWPLGATQDGANNNNCFSSRGTNGARNLPLDKSSAASPVD
jgi:hypothetical protein